ncbi:hypothetical protein IWQ56_003485, partial [Coemansia nantahalensis]
EWQTTPARRAASALRARPRSCRRTTAGRAGSSRPPSARGTRACPRSARTRMRCRGLSPARGSPTWSGARSSATTLCLSRSASLPLACTYGAAGASTQAPPF